MELFIAWTLVSCLVVQVMGQEPSCFTSGSIAGAVLGTFFATLVALAIGGFIYFKCCHKTSRKSTPPAANVEVGTRGFDNPCFEERASGRGGNDRRTSSDGPQAKREKGWTQFRLLPLSKSTERKAADDSFVTALERIEVPLRGHDFTGLGFNIAGNMRDGIYVKDVLNRGPASESGQITPGDRIESMTVSFRHMVFEDALTILSYASPYDVTLMLEKSGMQGKLSSPRRATSAASLLSPNVAVGGNLSGDIGSPGRLVHPLFRSQSIDDLSQIGKADLGAKVSVKLPSVDAKFGHNKLQNREANIEIETPTLEFPTGLEAKIGGGVNMPSKSKTTKFGVKVLPDLKLKASTHMEGIDVPDTCTVSIDTPSIGVSGPSIGGKGHKVKSGIDVNLPSADVNVSVPDISMLGLKVRGDPGLDVENGKSKKSSFSLKMPRLSFGKADADVSAKAPKVKIDKPKSDVAIDIADLPRGKFDADVDTDLSSKINMKMPQINVDVPKGSKKLKGKAPTANISADVALPSAKVDVNLPEAEFTGDVKVDKPKFGLKMPSLNIGMPSLNVSSNADSIDGKAPKLKVNSADFSLTKPELEINLPDVDIEAKGGKGSAGLKMPKLSVDVPSAEMSVDPLNLREMSVDIPDMPDVNLSTKGANVAGELSVDMPGIDKADKKGKKSKFSLKMPNINFGKAGAEMSADLKNANVNLPQPEVLLSGLHDPNLDLSIQPHSVEGGIAADINLPHAGKDAKSKFSMKMPSLGKHDAAISLGAIGGDMEMDRPRISAELPDIEAPNMNVKLKIPKPEISANTGSIDGNISMPEVTLPGTDVPAVGIDMPNADIDVDLNGKKSKFGLKMPNIQLGRPNMDLKVKGDLPNPEFGTGVDVDVNVPGGSINAGLEGTKGGKIKLPFKMPNLEHGQHQDVTFDPSKVDITLPNVNLPEIPDGGVSIQGPKVDLNLGGGSLEMPNIKPGIELPVLEGSVEGSLPKVDISASLPGFSLKKSKEMEIDVDTDIDSGKGKKGKFSMKLPSFGFGKAEGLDTGDWEGKIPKAEVSAEMPEIPDVNVSVKGPKAEIDLPDVHGDKKGKKSKFSMKMPHLNLGRTSSGISVEGNLPKSDVEIDTTVKVPSLEVDLPDIDVEGAKGKKSKFSLKMPHINFGRNTGSEGNVNIDIPNVTGDVDITDAGVRLEGPRLDVNPHEVDLSGKGKKVKYSVKLPPGVDGAKVDIGAGISGMDSEMSLKGPEVEIGLKDANLPEMKGKKSKFSMKMPNISFGKPQAEINVDTSGINGKLSKPEFSVSVPDMPDTRFDMPCIVSPTGEMDVELPEVELGENKGKKSKFSMKTPNINFGKNPVEVDLKAGGIEGRIPKPELSVTVPEVPDVDVDLPDLDIGDVKGKKSKFSMKMPNMSFGKPQADVSLGADGKLPKPEVSVNIPEIPDMNISLKAPGVDIEHPELDPGDMKGKKPKFSMKMPDMSFSKPHAEVSLGADGKFATPDLSVNALEVPDLNISVNAPEIDIEHPELDLSDIKGKKSKFSMKMPSMGFGKPHADVSIGVDGKLPKPEVSVALPEVPDVDISVSAPNIDIEHPELDLGGVKGKKSKFSMKMPSLGFEKPQVEGSFAADAKLSKPGMSVNVPEIPDVNIGLNALEVDIDNPELDLGDMKGKKGKFSMKMPGMNFGKPHAEVSLGADAKLPKPELEVRVPEIPDVSIALRAPEVDIENPDLDLGHMKGKKGKFSMKMPNLSFGKPHAEGSLGADGKLPKPELAMNVPEQPDASISLNAPEVELEIPELDLGDMKGKKPKFSMKMPSMSFGKPQGEVTLRAEGKLPQPEVSVAVPEVPDVNLSLNAPEVDVDLPDINVGDLKGKKSKFSMKMPNLGFGKPSAEIRLGADGKLPKSEMSVTVPDIPDASINLKAPEVDMEQPELDFGDLKGKKTKFSMKMPNLHFGKPHADISLGTDGVDAKLTKPEVSLPDVDFSLNAPDIDIDQPDLDLGEMKDKKSKFSMKMPSMSFGKPHADVTLGSDGRLPKPELSVNVPEVPDLNISVNAPEVDIDHPDNDLDGIKGKKSKFSMKMPGLNFGKPHIDVSLGTDGKLPKPEVSVDVPEVPDVKVSLKAPEVDVDYPELEIGDMKGKKSKFSMKMPGLNFGKPHLDSNFGVDGKLPKPEMSVNVPEVPDVSVSVNAPDVDISHPELDVGSLKGKKSKFSMKMPDFSFGKPHAEVSLGAEGKLPKTAVSVPDVDISVDVPEVDISHPDVDLGDLKGSKSKFSMKMPGLNIGMPHAEVSLGADGKLPMPELSVNVPDVPDVNISLNAPEVDIDHPDIDLGEMKGKKSKFSVKLPNLSLGKPHADVSFGVDGKLRKPEVSVVVPEVPDVDVSLNAPNVDISHPDIDLGDVKGKKSKFSMKMPGISFGKPHVDGSLGVSGKLPKPELSVNVPEVPDMKVSLNAPEVEIDQPELDLGDMKGKKSKFSMKMPNLSFGKPHADVSFGADGKFSKSEVAVALPEVQDVDISLKAPNIDIEHPELDLGDVKGKKPKFSMKMPSLGFGKHHGEADFEVGGVDGKIVKPELSVNLPEVPDVNIDLNVPEVDIDHPDLGELKGKKPKFSMKMPSKNFGKPHAEFSMETGGIEGKIPKSELSGNLPKLPDGDISLNAPEVDIEYPDVDLGEMKGKKSKFSMKMPHLNFGKPHAEISLGADGKLPKPEVSVAVPGVPDVDISVNAPDIDISKPELDLGDVKGKKSKFSKKIPSMSFGKPQADVTLGADSKVPKPELSVSVPDVPDVDITLNAPEVDIEYPELDLAEMKGKKGKFSMKMPSMSFGKSHAEVTLGADGILPNPELSVNAPDVDISLKAPEVDFEHPELDAGALKGKKTKFSMKMPSFGKPHADIGFGAEGMNIKSKKPEVSLPDVNVSLNAPDIEIDQPDIDLGEMKGKKSKFSMKMPGMNLGKPHAEVGIVGDGKLAKPGVSVNVPEIPEMNIALNAPEVGIEYPELDLTEMKGKKTKFSMKMPGLNFGKPHADVSLGANGKEPKLPQTDMSIPDVDVSLNASEVDVDLPDIGLGELKRKKQKFSMKMPDLSFGKPHAEIDFGLDGKMPETQVSVNVPEVPEASTSLSTPDIDVEHPDLDLGEMKGKKSKFSMKMPHLNFGKPHGEVTLGADGKLAKPDLSVNVPEVPDVNISLNAPDVDVEHPELDFGEIKGKKHKFSMKMPGLNFGKPHMDVNLGVDGKLPKPDVSVTVPDIPDANITLNAPEVDMEHPELHLGDLKGKKTKFSMKMPHLNFGGPHAEISLGTEGVDAKITRPEVSLPDMNVSLNAPAIDIEHPDLDLGEMKDMKSKFSMKMPSMSFGKPHADVTLGADVKLPKPELSVNVPEVPDLNVSVNAPEIDVDHPDIDLDGIKGKKSKFSMKMPSLNFGKPHVDVNLGTDGKLPKSEMSVDVPEVPDVNISLKAPEIDIEHPELDLGDPKGKKSKFSMKMPSLGFGKPHAEIDLQAEDIEGSIAAKGPRASVELPEFETEDLKGKKSKFSIKMPHVNFGKHQFDASVDSKDLNLPEVQASGLELDKPSANVSITVPQVPDASSSVNAPSVELQSDDLDLPHGKVKKGKFSMKMPHLSFGKHHSEIALEAGKFEGNLPVPSLTASTPSIDLNLKAPSAEIHIPDPNFSAKGNISLPSSDLSASLPEITKAGLSFGDLNADVDLPEAKTKKSKFNVKMPHVSIGKPCDEFSLSGNSGAVQWLPAELNMNTPTLSIDVPSAASSLEGSGVSLRGSAMEATADISSPLIEKLDIAGASKVNVKLPKLQTDVTSISAEVPGGFKSDTELDLDEQKHRLGLKLPKLKPNTLPEANFDIGGAAGLAESASSDQPRVSVAFRAPTFGLKTSTPAVQVATPALTTQLPSHDSLRFEESPEEDEIARKEPTKKKFSLKFPKLHMGKAHHETEVDPVDADVNLRVKPPQVDFQTDEGTAAALSKTSSDDAKLKKAMKVGVQVPAFSMKDKEDLDSSTTFKLPRARVSKNTPEEHKAAKLSDKESDDEEEEKPKGFRFGVKLKKSKGQSKSSSKTSLEEPLEIKIPRVDLSKKGSVELEGMEGLSPRDRAEMIKKNAKVSAGVRLPKYRGSLPGEETGPQLLGITRIPSVVENAEQHGYTEMAVDVPEEFLQRERALKGISNIVPSSFKVMVPLMNVQVEDTSKVTVRGNGAEFVTEGLFRSELKETIPKDVAASFNTENVVVTDTKGRKAASLGDLTRIVAVNDDSSLERTVSLDLRVGSDAVLSLGTNKRSYPDYPVQDLSRFSAEDLVTSKKKSQVFQNLALGAVEAEDKPFNNAPEPSARSVLAIEVNEAVWNPTSLYVSSYGPDGKALSPNSAGMGGRTDESLSGDTTITLESTPTASSNSSSRTSPLPLTEVRSSFTTVTLSNGNGAQLLELAPSELKNVTFTPVFHQEHVELGTRKAAEEDDDPSASTFAVVRERFEQLSRHSSSVEISKINDSHRVTVETNMRWEEGGSRLESPVQKPVVQIRPVVEEGALSKTVVISGLQLEQCDTSLQEVMSVESPVPTLEKPL